MIIVGSRFFVWGSGRTTETWRCRQCGAVTSFVQKKGMRFITLFFFIPVCPLSGVKGLLECPNCKERYMPAAAKATA